MIVKAAEHINADLVFPLSRFYDLADRELPEFQRVEGEALPEPARSLLVHDSDMTPTLEKFFGSRLRLKRLDSTEDDESAMRLVVLFDDRGRVVEFGAIRIEVVRFPRRAQRMIRQGRVPLGAVMKEHHIDHRSSARGYFQVQADSMMRNALRFTGDVTLYGRRNVITNHADQPLADVVEILPPMSRG